MPFDAAIHLRSWPCSGWIRRATTQMTTPQVYSKLTLPHLKVVSKPRVKRGARRTTPPRGLEPRTWWLHVTRNFFRTRTISLPSSLRYGSRCIVSEPSPMLSCESKNGGSAADYPRLYVRASSPPSPKCFRLWLRWIHQSTLVRRWTILLQFQLRFPVEAALRA